MVRLKGSTMKKTGIWFVSIMLMMGLLAGCGQNGATAGQNSTDKKGTINIGYVNWAEGIAVSNLWKVILEDKGYTVNLKSLDTAPLFVGLSKGDLDLFMDSWLPITHQSYWDKYKDNLDDYGEWYDGEAKIGLVVPGYVNINSITELNSAGDQFGGKIVGIDSGAGIMKATDKAVEDYGLNCDVVQSSEAAMMTALDKAYRDKQPIVITGWSPHWMFAKYDLKYLDDPKNDYGDAEGIHTLANKNFTQQNADLSQMLKAFKMNDQQIGILEGLINDGMKPEDAAKKWIDDNKNLVDSWTAS